MPEDGSEGVPVNHVGGQIETGVLMSAHLCMMQLWVPSSQEPRAEPEATHSVAGVVLPPGVGIAVSRSDSPCDFCFFSDRESIFFNSHNVSKPESSSVLTEVCLSSMAACQGVPS